jgi:hypothetical protein
MQSWRWRAAASCSWEHTRSTANCGATVLLLRSFPHLPESLDRASCASSFSEGFRLISLKHRAVLIGGGSTIAYSAVLTVLLLAGSRTNSDALTKIAIALFIPLFPSMLPGCLISVLMAFLGVKGFDGFHDNAFPVFPVISAPLVNSYIAYRWIKRRQEQQLNGIVRSKY